MESDEADARGAAQAAMQLVAGLPAALASTPKASRKRGDALPPPARSELTPNGHHVEHMMDAETPGGQHHGESSYTVLANTPHGETREARAARLAGDNKKKQRAWSRADALAHERVSAAAEWPDEVHVDEGAIVAMTEEEAECEAKRLRGRRLESCVQYVTDAITFGESVPYVITFGGSVPRSISV